MRRREFITLAGGAVACPVVARAQQAKMPVVGVLMASSQDDAEFLARNRGFRETMARLGWVDGRNVRFEYGIRSGEEESARKAVAEILRLSPSAILVQGTPMTKMLRDTAGSTPVVFVNAIDPVTNGLVESMARPGGNLTGFTNYEFPIGGKWLSTLMEVSSSIRRVLVLMPAGTDTGIFRNIEDTAKVFQVSVTFFTESALFALEQKLVEFARESQAGLIVLPAPRFLEQRELITSLAQRYRMPAIYHHRLFAESGGLMSYGIDNVEQFRKAAGYVARILRGDSPTTLPVQAPTKFEFVINLKTANALGITIPLSLIGRADEVIE